MRVDLSFRKQILSQYEATSEERAELLRYNENVFREMIDITEFPLADELFVAAWQKYEEEVKHAGSVLALGRHLVQLRFPIQQGISSCDEYLAATRRGTSTENMLAATGISLIAPDSCRLMIHATPAGRIPLLIAPRREDFVTLVRAFSGRNEPYEVPNSMGACMISGYNNWQRFRAALSVEQITSSSTSETFQLVKQKKQLYQDRFIILSFGPYSDVSAAEMGMAEDTWLDASLIIRREHECAHYFTWRVFSSMRNNLLDELIADYCGITAVAKRFRADWFLRFLGLESPGQYREGGRLQNYRGDPPLSDRAFAVLRRLVTEAAFRVEEFANGVLSRIENRKDTHVAMLLTLASSTLEELASETAQRILSDRLGSALERLAAPGRGFGGRTNGLPNLA